MLRERGRRSDIPKVPDQEIKEKASKKGGYLSEKCPK